MFNIKDNKLKMSAKECGKRNSFNAEILAYMEKYVNEYNINNLFKK